MHNLVLVSQSPRRRDLLSNAGFVFRCDTVKVSEIIEENLKIGDAIEAVARTKAEAWVNEHKPSKSEGILLLTADTVVFHENRVFGKPKNPQEAVQFLGLLSGKTHSVISGFCLWDLDQDRVVTRHESTAVTFKVLKEEDILAYVESGEPMDKAGAYAIQGEGEKFVQFTRGSWSNVVGLPMELFEYTLSEEGWKVERNEP